MIRRLRRIFAVIFIVGITALFLDFTGYLHALLGWMAKIQFLPALLALNVAVVAILVILTLILGRIYCSVICPLGVFQDLVAWMGRKSKKNRYSFSKGKTWLRLTVLAVFIIAMIAGVAFVPALLAPYSSYGRMVTMLLQPLYELGNNVLAYLAESMDSYAFYSVDVWMKSIATFCMAIVTFVVLVILAWRNGRTYCNTICPVGTVLGFFARFSWLKIVINDDKCIRCGKCAKNCKAACIDAVNHKIDYTRCVTCGDCLEECSALALEYGYKTKKGFNVVARGLKPTKKREERIARDFEKKQQSNTTADASRRAFVVGASLFAGAAAFAQEKKKVDGGLAVIEDKKPHERSCKLVPPGALSVKNFKNHCTACQLCVSKCPNGVLRPSTDLMTLMQPTMSYERGYCRPECTECSDVCPAGAIKPITQEDKSSVQIGHAVWVKENCIVLADDVPCGNCARHCPTGAISMEVVDTLETKSGRVAIVPTVDEAKCIGCGACEYVCPSRPFSAIYVEGHEVHRTI